MTDDAIKAAAGLLAMGIEQGRRDCFYCGEPGCKCGIERFDRMTRALEEIAEWPIHDEVPPRETFREIKEMAQDALTPPAKEHKSREEIELGRVRYLEDQEER